MEKEKEKFLKAEEAANELVDTLTKLLIEVKSYQTATEELEKVRQSLLQLIESTEVIARDSHQIIKILKEIGGPEILDRLSKLENKLTEEFAKHQEGMNELRKLIKEIWDTKILNGLIELENKLTEEYVKHRKGMSNLRKLIIVTLTSSIIAVIIGIIVLLR